MSFAALARLVLAAICYGHAETVEELIKKANEAGAPFTRVALERMNNTDLWGAKRGRRSVDIVIINASGASFNSWTPRCDFGSHVSPGLEPESNLYGHTSTVLGVYNGEDDKHEYGCDLTYCDDPNMQMQMSTYFEIMVVIKPYLDDIRVKVPNSSDIQLYTFMIIGANTQAIILVKDRYTGPVLKLSQQAPSLFSQREPKGSRNLFVKASKRGTSVHTI